MMKSFFDLWGYLLHCRLDLPQKDSIKDVFLGILAKKNSFTDTRILG